MFDPFAAALGAMFRAPGSAAAVYLDEFNLPQAIPVIRSQPNRDQRFGTVMAVVSDDTFSIRRSDVAEPADGSFIVLGATLIGNDPVGGEWFQIDGPAMLDTEGLTWSVVAKPVQPQERPGIVR